MNTSPNSPTPTNFSQESHNLKDSGNSSNYDLLRQEIFGNNRKLSDLAQISLGYFIWLAEVGYHAVRVAEQYDRSGNLPELSDALHCLTQTVKSRETSNN